METPIHIIQDLKVSPLQFNNSDLTTMTKYIPKILQSHMRFFSFFGCCAISLSGDLKCRIKIENWLVIWSSLLLVFFNIIALMALFSGEDFLFTCDKFGYFNDALKVVFANIAVTVSFSETILKRSQIKRFWTIYAGLQSVSKNVKDFTNKREMWENRRFLVIFYTFVVLEFVCLVVFITFKTMTWHLILFWSTFTPFMLTVHFRNMQFIFYIELLRLELLGLKQDLKLLVEYSRFVAYGCGFEGFEEFLRKKLLEKQKHYHLIYEMFQSFQNGFGLSIIAVLLMIYIRVLVDVYFAYYTFYRDLNKIEIVLLLPACLHIPMFLITSKCCMDVVQLITFHLHCIISLFNNRTGLISTQIQNFSLQILHQRICINGIGISRMDGYMLTRAIGSVTTYMIFFIQFMPKFTSVSDEKKPE